MSYQFPNAEVFVIPPHLDVTASWRNLLTASSHIPSDDLLKDIGPRRGRTITIRQLIEFQSRWMPNSLEWDTFKRALLVSKPGGLLHCSTLALEGNWPDSVERFRLKSSPGRYAAMLTQELDDVHYRVVGRTLEEIGDIIGTGREAVRQHILSLEADVGIDLQSAILESQARIKSTLAATRLETIFTCLCLRPGQTLSELAREAGLSNELVQNHLPDYYRRFLARPAPPPDPKASTPEKAIRSLQTAHSLLSDDLVTAPAYDRLVREGLVPGPMQGAVIDHFGSWSLACRAAGVPFIASQCGRKKVFFDDTIDSCLVEFILDPTVVPTVVNYNSWRDLHVGAIPSSGFLCKRFGTWVKVISHTHELLTTPEHIGTFHDAYTSHLPTEIPPTAIATDDTPKATLDGETTPATPSSPTMKL